MKKLRKGGYSSEDIFDFLRPRGMVLDLGCGGGRNTAYMANQGLQVVGVDISYEQLKKGSLVTKRCQADACCLPFKADSFDYVLCSELLEHLASPGSCISEVYRILKDGGIAVITCPCLNVPCKAIVPIYRKLAGINPKRAKEHLHVFSTRRLKEMTSPYFEMIAVSHVKFLSITEQRLGIGYKLDVTLSTISRKVPLLCYLAAAVWIKVRKKEQDVNQGA